MCVGKEPGSNDGLAGQGVLLVQNLQQMLRLLVFTPVAIDEDEFAIAHTHNVCHAAVGGEISGADLCQ